MNWYKKARYGGAAQERSIWYHGTRGRNLPKILSEGLIAFPKERAWGHSESNFDSPSKASLGGIYLTQNLMTARSSAIKNKNRNEDMVIVVIEAQPRTFLMDEDNIYYSIKDSIRSNQFVSSPYLTTELYMAKIMKTNQDYVQGSKDNYIKSSISDMQHKFNVPDIIKEQLIKILSDNWQIVLNRQISHVDYQTFRNAFFRNLSEETNKKIREKYKEIRTQYKEDNIFESKYNEYIDSLMPRQPTSQKAEKDFADLLNKLTRLLKDFARPNKQKDTWNLTARTEENIGFSGSNKIICIVSENSKYEAELIYGQMPEKLINDWNKNVGEMRMKT